MSRKEAKESWDGTQCPYCHEPKHTKTTFCNSCRLKLTPQSQADISLLTNEDYLVSVADAEKELLALESEAS